MLQKRGRSTLGEQEGHGREAGVGRGGRWPSGAPCAKNGECETVAGCCSFPNASIRGGMGFRQGAPSPRIGSGSMSYPSDAALRLPPWHGPGQAAQGLRGLARPRPGRGGAATAKVALRPDAARGTQCPTDQVMQKGAANRLQCTANSRRLLRGSSRVLRSRWPLARVQCARGVGLSWSEYWS